MLFLCYLIVAASFYVHSDQDPDGKLFTSELSVVLFFLPENINYVLINAAGFGYMVF